MEQSQPSNQRLIFPPKFQALFRPHRYKVFYGGRGAGKSVNIARVIILKADARKERILCCREFQNSIRDSVHRLLTDQIEALGLSRWFDVTGSEIRSLRTGSEIIFKGLRHNAPEIKSTEGVDICWVEEAQLVSQESWEMLVPTIRTERSEIWVSFNPAEETDPTYQRFVLHPPPNAYVAHVNFDSNPWFPKVLEEERQYCLRSDPDNYDHVWLGACRSISSAIVFRGKYVIESFEPPTWPNEVQFYCGEDFGFSEDPSACVRCWTTGKPPEEELWVDQEAWGLHIEIDALPAFMDRISNARRLPWVADSARPDTISYIARQGFTITGAPKYGGCVEERIQHLKGFKQIHIHERCKHLQEELRLYSYKVDRRTQLVLPELVDANNHLIDALGYALSEFVIQHGDLGVWLKL
jgi:phage terminase large subunit